jgi:universal stress protein A
MPGKIIFPTDFSTASDIALPYATDMAKARGATLMIVHVEEPPFAYCGGELYYGVPGPDENMLAAMLAQLRPSDPAVPFERRMLVGEPAHAIIKLARDENADLIVMGSHGRAGFGRVLLGSIAELIVRRATCPVLVVKHPQIAPPIACRRSETAACAGK